MCKKDTGDPHWLATSAKITLLTLTHHILTYMWSRAVRITHHASRITRMWSRSFTPLIFYTVFNTQVFHLATLNVIFDLFIRTVSPKNVNRFPHTAPLFPQDRTETQVQQI